MKVITHFWRHLKDYKRNAMLRGYAWELTDHEFAKIVSKNCHYCGVEPRPLARRTRSGDPAITKERLNGIDRKDPKLGYTTENSVPCCKFCNSAKWMMGEDEFKEHILKIAGHLK